jgi:hypothetical protein
VTTPAETFSFSSWERGRPGRQSSDAGETPALPK